jgi:hypothetical protein
MKPAKEMTSEELSAEWLACEQYIGDPDPGNDERMGKAIQRQLEIEEEQDRRGEYEE